MRTSEEIAARIQERMKLDPIFGWEPQFLVVYLSSDRAKALFPSLDIDEWEPCSLEPDSIREEMRNYIPFAWEKIQDERGISASRSMAHFSVWVWLLGDDLGELTTYTDYGAENLRKICRHYGWPELIQDVNNDE
jgi:hypothetical protein